MTLHTLKRDGDRPIQFEGERISRASTHRASKNIWTELEFYRTEAGSWVVATIGRTNDENKVDLFAAEVYTTADDLYAGLCVKGGSLSAPARELLELAADELEEIDTLLDDKLSQPEHIA